LPFYVNATSTLTQKNGIGVHWRALACICGHPTKL